MSGALAVARVALHRPGSAVRGALAGAAAIVISPATQASAPTPASTRVRRMAAASSFDSSGNHY